MQVNNRRKRTLGGLMLCLLSLCLLGAVSFGESGILYTVKARLPYNQLDHQAGYFDLLMRPEQVQVLEVFIQNDSDEEIEVLVESNTAFTNAHGAIDLSSQERDETINWPDEALNIPLWDENLPLYFADIALVEEEIVTVPAHGSAVAEIRVTMPKEPFEGVIQGGFMFTKLGQGEMEQQGGGMSIRNIYRYAIGVRLRMDRDERKIIQPDFTLDAVTLGDGIYPSVRFRLGNPMPLIAKDITFGAEIYPLSGGEKVASFLQEGLSMAPHTAAGLTLYFPGGEMNLGEGQYRVEATLGYEGKTWTYQETLTIHKDQLSDY